MSPIILAVDVDPDTLPVIERDLSHRYGADYRVLAEGSAGAALGTLAGAAARGEEVALLLATQWMQEMTGIEFLTRAHELHPGAKRVLVIDVGDTSAEQPITRALTLNQLDYYVGKPWATPEEEFYPVTGEALREWAKAHLPRYEKVRIVGDRRSPEVHLMLTTLERNGVTPGLYPVDTPEGQALIAQYGLSEDTLPACVLYDGRVFLAPSPRELAAVMGAITVPAPGLYDVAIIGLGPAGLAAALYAASEGLKTVALEPEAFGGQAGTAPMIHNYLGFPWGVSGQELARKAERQAVRFGASLVYGEPAINVRAEGKERIVTLADGNEVVSRAIVIATGVTYRRLDAPGIDRLVGAGVFYGATVADAQALRGEHVYIVGAGNSAGEAALHLADYSGHVTLVVRGSTLSRTMSHYLIEDIESRPNITVRLQTEVVEGIGKHYLERLALRHRVTAATESVPAAGLFLLIGAEPHTGWLPPSIARDERGYILTGRDVPREGHASPALTVQRLPALLETSLPGVFAAGDVRHRSLKRVAAAVGEGSTAIHMVHEYLAEM